MIGLVGGIGSGKSYLARELQQTRELQKKRRVVIVEGDKTGHEVLTEEAVRHAVRREFGDGVFDAQGQVDRRSMSAVVFGSSPQAREARANLEAIVHPRIKERLTQEIAAARTQGDVEAIILDAALMLEAGWRTLCDRVVFVDVPDDVRRRRVTETRGWSLPQLKAREESQFPLERKRMEADDVVDNSQAGTVAVAQLEEIISRVQSKASPGIVAPPQPN